MFLHEKSLLFVENEKEVENEFKGEWENDDVNKKVDIDIIEDVNTKQEKEKKEGNNEERLWVKFFQAVWLKQDATSRMVVVCRSLMVVEMWCTYCGFDVMRWWLL